MVNKDHKVLMVEGMVVHMVLVGVIRILVVMPVDIILQDMVG